MKNMNLKARTSGAHLLVQNLMITNSQSVYLEMVSDSWAMVLLKEIYLKSFNHAKNILIANILSDCSVHQLRVSKSP